jgi:lysophospholipid acyltransferase (LPLAT)-like uncharacterized protein
VIPSERTSFNRQLQLALIPSLGGVLHRFLGRTVRFTELNAGAWGLRAKRSENAIYAFWHSSLLMSSFFYRNLGVVGLISQSRDGELLTRVLEPLGYVIVRGSTSRGSARAFRSLVRHLREGRDVALAPDGPRGPREVVQVGIIELARLTGRRIVPFVFDCTRKKRLNSWDRLIVPAPFARGVIAVGDPISIDRRADELEVEAKRKMLEEALHDATRRAAEWIALRKSERAKGRKGDTSRTS